MTDELFQECCRESAEEATSQLRSDIEAWQEKCAALDKENAKLRGWLKICQRKANSSVRDIHKLHEQLGDCERKLTAHQAAGRQPHMRP